MIKPFKVLETRLEKDGTTGVIFEVSKVISAQLGKSKTTTMTSYINVSQGVDIDQFLFDELSKAGWL